MTEDEALDKALDNLVQRKDIYMVYDPSKDDYVYVSPEHYKGCLQRILGWMESVN